MVYRDGKLALKSKIHIVCICSKSNSVVEIGRRFLVKNLVT